MSSLLEGLMGQLGGSALEGLSSQLGTDKKQTQAGVAAALPVLMGTLGKAKKQGNMNTAQLSDMLGKERDTFEKQCHRAGIYHFTRQIRNRPPASGERGQPIPVFETQSAPAAFHKTGRQG